MFNSQSTALYICILSSYPPYVKYSYIIIYLLHFCISILFFLYIFLYIIRPIYFLEGPWLENCKKVITFPSLNKPVLCCIVLHWIVLCCSILYYIVLYCTVLYSTVLYSTLLYSTLLYCTVLYCILDDLNILERDAGWKLI